MNVPKLHICASMYVQACMYIDMYVDVNIYMCRCPNVAFACAYEWYFNQHITTVAGLFPYRMWNWHAFEGPGNMNIIVKTSPNTPFTWNRGTVCHVCNRQVPVKIHLSRKAFFLVNAFLFL